MNFHQHSSTYLMFCENLIKVTDGLHERIHTFMRSSGEEKGKVVPVHAMRAYWGSRGITPLILNLSARQR
jgi:hypothetical protein